jgi:DNA-directed RNA polymerase specialized sigma24 family protein
MVHEPQRWDARSPGLSSHMRKSQFSPPPCNRQLDELFADPGFVKIVDLVTKEVMRLWGVPHAAAHGFVVSAIGEPETLACIHNAWSVATSSSANLGLVKVIIRRRVIDLLRKDARHANHCSLPTTVDAIDTDPTPAFHELVQRDPRLQLELQQIIHMVRGALDCFATQGEIQDRQARLLRRYALDEVHYAALSTELACSESALRVRVHKAMLALRKHIRQCHAELEDLLERDRGTAAAHVG